MQIGILALQGGVSEHVRATEEAASGPVDCETVLVRAAGQLEGLSGLIIPGGESTALAKLCAREGMLDAMRRVPCIFGTCAGAIMLASEVRGAGDGQETLGLMDMAIERNSYGRQAESFEEELDTVLGRVRAVFIRAPRITRAGDGVRALAARNGETVACEQESGRSYWLAACFHPELSTGVFHRRFLDMVALKS